ncbi:MAG: GIY-YIG nuclease family protein [Putridiphycobacter sp.]
MIYYVYILLCSDNTYYTGVTSNLNKRIDQHNSSYFENSYTSKRLPVRLVYYCEFIHIGDAIDKEKQIKKWSKAKKEALINGKFKLLPNLAKKQFK